MAELVTNRSVPLSAQGQCQTRLESGHRNRLRPGIDTFFRIGHRVALALTILLVCGVGGLYVVRTVYSGKVLPSVYVADVPVGGLARADAQAAVDARADALLTATIVFDYDGRQWTTSLAELGVTADTIGSVDQAYGLGREASTRDRIESSLNIAKDDQVVPLSMVVDSGAVQSWVDGVTADIGMQPSDARIIVDGVSVTIEDEVDGIVVDRERLRAIIAQSIEQLSPYRGPLPVTFKSADIHASDLESAAATLTESLSAPITIVYKEKSWTIQPKEITPFIVQSTRGDGQGVDLAIDVAGLGQWLFALIGERINRDAVDATIQWSNEKERVVAKSDSSKGIRLLSGPLADMVAASFFDSHADVQIPVKGIAPRVDSDQLDKLNITQRLSVGTSAFWGSNQDRATNIRVGTELLNGAVVKPGEVFSFNGAIGDIGANPDFVEAPVIQGERIGKGNGGGICQVSTTVFRAAFFAGLPMVEWWPHLYRLSFYELDGWTPGIDASILQPGSDPENWGDFKFLNSTDGHLLIEAYVDAETETDVVVIYGPDTGWDVSISEPQMGEPILGADQPDIEVVDPELDAGTWLQSEYPTDGVIVSYVRTVTDRDGTVLEEETFTSSFAARGNVYKVSPDMEGQSPAQDVI